MSTEQNKINARRSIEEGFNQHSLALIEEFAAPDYLTHITTGETQNLAAYKQFLSAFFAAFPDLHFTIDDLLADGGKTVTRWTARGAHRGDLLGIPPTGKQVTVTGVTITRWGDGKAIESWISFDNLHLLQQLGAAPNPAEAR